jgi:hypothetical protein
MKIFVAAAVAAVLAHAAFADIPAGIAALEKGDAELAAATFAQSFEAGDADGAFYLGRMFEMGLGAAPDMIQATSLYQASADNGSVLAQNRLGLMYLDGQGVLKDYVKGAELVCKAADQGDANAQFNCGAVYAEGRGVEADKTKAIGYWDAASVQDHIAATNLLAMSYKNADGVEADAGKMFELFNKTAKVGNALGLYEVALAYQSGTGTDADAVKAYTFANIASAMQHPDAPALRDTIEKTLTTAQVTGGQTAARDWMVATQAEIDAQNALKTADAEPNATTAKNEDHEKIIMPGCIWPWPDDGACLAGALGCPSCSRWDNINNCDHRGQRVCFCGHRADAGQRHQS